MRRRDENLARADAGGERDAGLRKYSHDRRQFQAESATAFRAIEAENIAAMLLHHAIADAEAEAGALAYGLDGVEGIENFIGLFHARASVGKFDDDQATFAQRANQKDTTASGLHSIHAIADQVIEDLEQLIGVAANGRQDAAIFEFDADVLFAQVQVTQLNRAGEYGVEIQQLLFGRHLAGEAEQVGDEFLGAASLFANFLAERVRAAFGRILKGQEVGITEDGGERIIDFVRGAGRQLAQRGEFFRLNEVSLEALDVFERIPKFVNELSAFLVDEVRAEENQGADDEDGGQSDQDAKFPHRFGSVAEFQSPNRQERGGEAANAGEAGGPLGIALDGRGHRLRLEFQLAGDDAGDADPDEGAEHG